MISFRINRELESDRIVVADNKSEDKRNENKKIEKRGEK